MGHSGDLAQRAHVDAGCAHVDEEVRDAAMLGFFGIRAGQQNAPVAVLGP